MSAGVLAAWGRKGIIYLCGPIAGRSDADCKDWRQEVTDKWGADFVRNPMRRDYRGVEIDVAIAEEIVEGDKQDILECDGIIVFFDQPSVGTSMEVMFAHQQDRIVIIINRSGKPVSPWLLYHSHAIVDTIDEALEFLR